MDAEIAPRYLVYFALSYQSKFIVLHRFRKIFIGGLSYSTDDGINCPRRRTAILHAAYDLICILLCIDKLRQYFDDFGPVQDAVVMKDPVTRFGFITFDDASFVDIALAQDVHTINSRNVCVAPLGFIIMRCMNDVYVNARKLIFPLRIPPSSLQVVPRSGFLKDSPPTSPAALRRVRRLCLLTTPCPT